MQMDLLWAFVLIFALDSITPGPAVAMVMSRGASVGLAATLPFIAGLVVGDLLLFALALLGLVALVNTLGPFFFVIKWVGIVYLLYLAYRMWTTKPIDHKTRSVSGTGFKSFVVALFLPLGNPKAVGFYLALLPAFMDVDKLLMTTALYFSLAIVIIWSLVLIGYTAAADHGRRRFNLSFVQNWLNKGCAVAMIGAAGTVAFRD